MPALDEPLQCCHRQTCDPAKCAPQAALPVNGLYLPAVLVQQRAFFCQRLDSSAVIAAVLCQRNGTLSNTKLCKVWTKKVKCACRTGDHASLPAAEAQASGSECSLESTQQQLQMAGEGPLA